MISTLDIACMQIELRFQESVYVIHLYHILPQNILAYCEDLDLKM